MDKICFVHTRTCLNCGSEFLFSSLQTDAKIFRNGCRVLCASLHAPLAFLLPSFPRCIPPSFNITPSFCGCLFITLSASLSVSIPLCFRLALDSSLLPSSGLSPFLLFQTAHLPCCLRISNAMVCIRDVFPLCPLHLQGWTGRKGKREWARGVLHCRLRGVTTPQQRQLFAKCCRRAGPAGRGEEQPTPCTTPPRPPPLNLIHPPEERRTNAIFARSV